MTPLFKISSLKILWTNSSNLILKLITNPFIIKSLSETLAS
jgi:hypothetical protein